MGWYVETGTQFQKANLIATRFKGRIVSQSEAKEAMNDPTKGVIVVINNGPFEAAGFAFDMGEFEAFTLPDDFRPKQYVILDRAIAEQACNFHGKRLGDP